MVGFDYSNALPFVSEKEISAMETGIMSAVETLLKGTGEGNGFLGWTDLPVNYDRDEFVRIKKAAEKIRKDSDVLLVIGIGGSYLGARAVTEALTESFYNLKGKNENRGPRIFFCGNSISTKYTADIINYINETGADFSINVISKSGTTTEPAIAFRIFKKLLMEKYGKKEAAGRIYATTDRAKGALKTLSDKESFEEFVVPDNIGGRFSVLTAVGLLPIAAAGIDIDALMEGAAEARKVCLESNYAHNPALKYAAVRNLLLKKGRSIEILANYEPSLHYFAEWWKQLYGESEGKDKKGIFPAAVDLTADLHSMGQYIQDGPRIMFETVLNVEKQDTDILISAEEEDLDQLNYLEGKDLDFVNKSAMKGTVLAHVSGNVPNLMFNIERLDEKNVGELIYIFEYACGVSGYVLGVNPFNQPGVEAYKKNMFALLGKPGYEKILEDR